MMQNLKITFKIDNYINISDNPLDGVFAKLYFEKQKQEGKFNGDYFQILPFIEFDKEGFYHVSNPIFDIKLEVYQTMYKNFSPNRYIKEYPYTKITNKLFDPLRGTYKAYQYSLHKTLVDDVIVYVRGKKDIIKDLLYNLTNLGKKSSLSWGKIKRVTIEETEEDYSIVKNGILNRHVPLNSKYLKDINCDTGVRLMQLTHPYWDAGRETYCVKKI